jgi:hypothetical protein
MKKIVFVFLMVTIVSCKNNKEESVKKDTIVDSEIMEPAKPNKFIVSIELKYSQTEYIKLFTNDVFINNNRSMSISLKEKVTKSNKFKTVLLDFPEDIKPDYQVGVSFGTKVVKSIEIKSVRVSYGDVEFAFTSQELNNYFVFNKFIDYNPETGLIQTKKVDGRLNPIMFLRGKITDKL